MSIKIYEIESFKDLNSFWNMFYDYINYIFEISPLSKKTSEYFLSEEYKNSVLELSERDFNPLKIIFFKEKDKILGFATYIIYIDEKGESIILEYCINKEFRNKGLGKIAYSKLQERMIKEGAKTIELTPTNKRNELFWKNNGFSDTMIFCQDGRHLLMKKLNS
ncbi:GNAT family N-acetyltransferase [Clostridium perfringens]|uniref:GNAT family N-acetyltransferase n=1 Tax=Clostridium perfringens TaxID=1502 RepID=UPI0011269B8C|nr:GNAT family N-acetyltransferase [Clostridium perfringens]MBO3328398.1 GNAT family N-acetyltransferase [Clostridium perfringens]MDK0918259.1 GNAT family N-acetyltransferase [Clostridium perfringens]MDM0876188.1 GNAT family N-acetyltransferase [Clostridium perfringens]TPG00237.1 GNAT family N-acetyltransferase [Clostridium perfringens A]HAT4116023.1 GNAT family N-acetyltransferase [Clostridium perfringens]